MDIKFIKWKHLSVIRLRRIKCTNAYKRRAAENDRIIAKL